MAERGNDDLRRRHPHLARPRVPRVRGSDRRGALARQWKEVAQRQVVLLGITWKPTPGGVFTRLQVSDIWLDDAAMQRAAHNQNKSHKAFIRGRWMHAWIDAVEYGKFGRAKVTATLFGGMDESLYADFKTGSRALMAASENTLKHWSAVRRALPKWPQEARSSMPRRRTERFHSGEVASQSALRRTSLPRAFAPQESSAFALRPGPMSTCRGIGSRLRRNNQSRWLHGPTPSRFLSRAQGLWSHQPSPLPRPCRNRMWNLRRRGWQRDLLHRRRDR